MFLKSKNIFNEKKNSSSLSIIAQGIDFVGEIVTEGNIHIDGNMKGSIKAHEVVIGPEGDFEGEINSDYLIVSGKSKGKYVVKNIHIKKEGFIQGKAKYELIVVDAGGKIQGELGIAKQTKATKNIHKENNNTTSNSTSNSNQKTNS